jgi:hypothetical protein
MFIGQFIKYRLKFEQNHGDHLKNFAAEKRKVSDTPI